MLMVAAVCVDVGVSSGWSCLFTWSWHRLWHVTSGLAVSVRAMHAPGSVLVEVVHRALALCFKFSGKSAYPSLSFMELKRSSLFRDRNLTQRFHLTAAMPWIIWDIVLPNLSNCNSLKVSDSIFSFSSDILQFPIILVFQVSNILILLRHRLLQLRILREDSLISWFPMLLLLLQILQPSLISFMRRLLALELILQHHQLSVQRMRLVVRSFSFFCLLLKLVFERFHLLAVVLLRMLEILVSCDGALQFDFQLVDQAILLLQLCSELLLHVVCHVGMLGLQIIDNRVFVIEFMPEYLWIIFFHHQQRFKELHLLLIDL